LWSDYPERLRLRDCHFYPVALSSLIHSVTLFVEEEERVDILGDELISIVRVGGGVWI